MADRSPTMLLRRGKSLARLLRSRVSNLVTQAIFLGCMHQRWTYSEIGVYLGVYALFSLSSLIFSTGLEKQVVRLRTAGPDAVEEHKFLVDRIATYGLLLSLTIGAYVFSYIYPHPLPPLFLALLFVGAVGMSLRVFTANATERKVFVTILDTQLHQAAALRLVLSVAVLLQADPLQVLSIELLGITASNLAICHRYKLAIRYAVGSIRWRFVTQVGLLFVSKLLQQLVLRFLLLIPAAHDEFHSAGLFGLLQKAAGLVTSVAEFIVGRLHIMHDLFDPRRTLGSDYRRRARIVVSTTGVSALVVAVLAMSLAEGEHLLAFLLMLATSPLQVWRTEMSNEITQRQTYWISPLSYLPATVLTALATFVSNLTASELSLLLLSNVVLNVIAARLLLRRQS